MKLGGLGRRGTEGRCVVEGLVEGPLPDDGSLVEFLRTWERERHDEGFDFQVTIDGGRFDIHAHDVEVPAPEVGRDPVDVLADALRALIEALPGARRAEVHSTLRAAVYGRGTARRTLFAVRTPGVLEVVEDRALAETVAPEPPDLSRGPRHWAFWITLVLAVVVFAVWGPGLSPLGWGDLSSVDPDALELSSSADGLDLTGVQRDPGARGPWYVVVRRESAAPDSAPAPDDADAWLAWLGNARGRAFLEWRDDAGSLLRVDPIGIEGLEVGQERVLSVLAPPPRATDVRFGW